MKKENENNQNNQNNQNKRILWIDAIRSICVLYIIGKVHLFGYIDFTIPNNTILCQMAYCVLSTYTFFAGYFALKNISNKKDILLFYKKKIIRIYPLFLISSILFVICNYNEKISVLYCALGVGMLVKNVPLTLWYVCMLIIFWLITPIILRFLSGYVRYIAMFGIEVIFILLTIMNLLDERFLYYWPFYCIGLIAKEVSLFNKLFQNKHYILFSILFLIAFLCTAYISETKLYYMSMICSVLFILSFSGIFNLIFSHVNSGKIIQFISYSSFCAYLFHRPIYYLMNKIIGDFSIIETYILIIPITLLISGGIQYSYDKLINKICK